LRDKWKKSKQYLLPHMEPNFESKWPNFVWNKRLTNIHEMRGEDVWEQPKYLAFVFVGVRVGWEDRKKVGGRTRRAIMQRWICMNFIWGGWDITTSKQMNKKFRSRSNEAKSYQKNNYIFSRSNKKKDIWKQRESERERDSVSLSSVHLLSKTVWIQMLAMSRT
jgi:hypothetical protein